MIPIINAESALTKTAAADRSFAFLINGSFEGEVKSARFSIDEFISSKEITRAIANRIRIHSYLDISNR